MEIIETIEILKNDHASVKTFIWGYFVLFIIVCGFDYIITKIAKEKRDANNSNRSNNNNLE